MPSRKRDPVSNADARAIEQAYYHAKIANPKLTQREFARKALPTIQQRYDDAKSPAEKRRIEESGARYLRLVLEGKRTGTKNVGIARKVRIGQGSDQFQATIRDANGNVRSFDIVGIGARSQLDVPLMEAELREHRDIFGRKLTEWTRRYGDAFGELDIEDLLDTLQVRRVLIHRKHAERIAL